MTRIQPECFIEAYCNKPKIKNNHAKTSKQPIH